MDRFGRFFPVFLVFSAFLFNALVGIFGIGKMTSGLLLAVLSGWSVYARKTADDADIEKLRGFLTGGNSFAFLSIPWAIIVLDQPASSFITKIGEFPLYDLRLRIVDVAKTAQELTLKIGDFGSSMASIGAPSIEGPQIPQIHDDEYFRVFFTARNDVWIQDIILRKSARSSG